MTNHGEHGHGAHGNAHGAGHESPLETMLHALSDDSIAEKVTVPHREARESFSIENHLITDYQEFTKAISDYVKHHKKKVAKTEDAEGATLNDEQAFAEAYLAIQQAFRNYGGMKHAIELAKRGQFREVIDAIAGQLEKRAGDEYRFFHTEGKIAPDDFDTKTAVVKGLFDRMRTIEPTLKFGKPELFAHEYETVVARYHDLVRSVREQYGVRETHGDDGHSQERGYGVHAAAGAHH